MKFGQRWSTTARCSLLFKCIGSPTSFRSIVPSIIPITVIQIYFIFPILFGLEYFNSLICLSDFVSSVSSYLSCLQYLNSWYLGQSYFIIFNRFNRPFHWSPMFQHLGKKSWAPTLNHPGFTYQTWVCKYNSQMVNAMALRVPYHVLFHQHAPWNIGYSEHPVNCGFSMLLVIPNTSVCIKQSTGIFGG